jgi:hypothetical protein
MLAFVLVSLLVPLCPFIIEGELRIKSATEIMLKFKCLRHTLLLMMWVVEGRLRGRLGSGKSGSGDKREASGGGRQQDMRV